MAEKMLIERKIILSKRFPPGVSKITFGRYKLQSIPSISINDTEAVFSFDNTFEDCGGSNPEEETNIVISFLSLFLNLRVKKEGFRINSVDIPILNSKYKQFIGMFDPSIMEKFFPKIFSLSETLVRQFIRASKTYSFALEFIPSDPTFAFFLLVVSAECISSQDEVIPFSELNPDSNKCERFCRFVLTSLLDNYKGNDEQNKELVRELLKTAYYSHRSGFVHGGKEVSHAALMADKAVSSYFKHATEGKEIKTPGLAWFAKIIQGSLLGFLEKFPSTTKKDEDVFSKIAVEKARLKIKAKKAVKKGVPVTFGDIEFR